MPVDVWMGLSCTAKTGLSCTAKTGLSRTDRSGDLGADHFFLRSVSGVLGNRSSSKLVNF